MRNNGRLVTHVRPENLFVVGERQMTLLSDSRSRVENIANLLSIEFWGLGKKVSFEKAYPIESRAVSYTHLTLPTILRV